MKTTSIILCCLALLSGLGSLQASTPVSADGYLVSPWDYEGQTIKLNVAFVRPARFQSPFPDIIFFHAMTLTAERRSGGEILIAVPKDESEHFARYFSMDPHGRNSRILSGTLLLAHRPHPPLRKWRQDGPTSTSTEPETTGTTPNENKPARWLDRAGVWFVDYKGVNADLFHKNKDIQIPEAAGPSTNPSQSGNQQGTPINQ